MNLYFKHWKLNEINPELHHFYGVSYSRFYKHLRSYRGWEVAFMLPQLGMFSFTIVDNKKEYIKEFGEWSGRLLL